MKSWPRVCVVGAGAVGCYFGGRLAQAGAPVTLLGRPAGRSTHLDTIARDGLRIVGVDYELRLKLDVSTDPDAVADADLVLFCVKTTDTESAARQIVERLPKQVAIVSLQNGVDNVEKMCRIGLDPIAAVVFVAAAVEKPGEVMHRGRGDLVIGHADRVRAERVAAWFEAANVPCPVSDDVERDLWIKLTVNSMANAISALTGASYGEIADDAPAWALAVEVARESVLVARANSIDLEQDALVQTGLEICRSVGPATSSTQQDVARGRPTEIDALNGYLARRGRELGLATPANHALWALVKLLEKKQR